MSDDDTKEKEPEKEPIVLWKDYIAQLIADGKLTEEDVFYGMLFMDYSGLQGFKK